MCFLSQKSYSKLIAKVSSEQSLSQILGYYFNVLCDYILNMVFRVIYLESNHPGETIDCPVSSPRHYIHFSEKSDLRRNGQNILNIFFLYKNEGCFANDH